MTVAELKKILDAALERGIDPKTTVVIDNDGSWQHVRSTDEPTLHPTDNDIIWFTLYTGDYADPRFDYGMYKEEV